MNRNKEIWDFYVEKKSLNVDRKRKFSLKMCYDKGARRRKDVFSNDDDDRLIHLKTKRCC